MEIEDELENGDSGKGSDNQVGEDNKQDGWRGNIGKPLTKTAMRQKEYNWGIESKRIRKKIKRYLVWMCCVE